MLEKEVCVGRGEGMDKGGRLTFSLSVVGIYLK